MAARLTDKQKKKVIADYVEMGSYNAVARKHKIAVTTVKRICERMPETKQTAMQKKEENTKDMLAYMDSRKGKAQEAVDLYLEALTDPEKIQKAPLEKVATALGIVVDKFTKTTSAGESSLEKLDGLLKEFQDAVKPEAD